MISVRLGNSGGVVRLIVGLNGVGRLREAYDINTNILFTFIVVMS